MGQDLDPNAGLNAPDPGLSCAGAGGGGEQLFVSDAGNLFRMIGRARQERWDASSGSWVGVDDYVFYKAFIDADPTFDEVDPRTAQERFPAAFSR